MTHTSREYAEALYALSEEEGRTEEYLSALSLTEETLAENPGFLMLLASPAISREERMNALEAALRDRIPLVCRGNEVLLAAGVGTGAVPRWSAEARNIRVKWTGRMPWTAEERKETDNG